MKMRTTYRARRRYRAPAVILREARKWLDDFEHWHVGGLHNVADPNNPAGKVGLRTCAIGAVGRYAQDWDAAAQAEELLQTAAVELYGENIADINDGHGGHDRRDRRRYRKVMASFDRALELAKR